MTRPILHHRQRSERLGGAAPLHASTPAAAFAAVWLALVLILLTGCSDGPPPVRGNGTNVILIVLDTVRADRLGCYGNDRGITPRTDALAARGVRFQTCASTSSWTLPAHASLFTGTYPVQHRATQEATKLDDHYRTAAELFRDAGYRVVAVCGNPVVSPATGLARGFDEFHETWRDRYDEIRAAGTHANNAVVERFLDGLQDWRAPDGARRKRPFFLFVNYIDAHSPYEPPEPFRSRFAPGDVAHQIELSRENEGVYYLDRSRITPADFRILSALYDAEIAYVDEWLGRLIEALERRGLMQNTLVLITSDHGENFGEHGHHRHVFSLYNTTVRVPLIALLPGGARAGELRPEPVQIVSLFETMLSAAGLEPPADQSAHQNLLAAGGPRPENLFAGYYFPSQALQLMSSHVPAGQIKERGNLLKPFLRRIWAAESDGMRLIRGSDGKAELYDVRNDPGETINLWDSPGQEAPRARLSELLDGHLSRHLADFPLPPLPIATTQPRSPLVDDDDERTRKLRSLGYVP